MRGNVARLAFASTAGKTSLMEWFVRRSTAAAAADPDAVSDERGLALSADLFTAFAHSPEELREELGRNRRHLKRGTHYLD